LKVGYNFHVFVGALPTHTHILNHNFEFKKKGQCGGFTATLLYVLD